MDPNLPRWILSSLANYFKVVADGIPLNYHIEGMDEDEAQDFQNDSVLFRMAGPIAFQSPGSEWYTIEIQLLLTDIMHATTDNAYDLISHAGIFQAAMQIAIPVNKRGNGPSDDNSLLGCLAPDPSVKNNIRIVNYGVLDREDRVRQMSVNGKFLLCL